MNDENDIIYTQFKHGINNNKNKKNIKTNPNANSKSIKQNKTQNPKKK